MTTAGTPRILSGLEGIRSSVGEELGVSGWITVDQARIDAFARTTDDHQWIHVDAHRAEHGPYGSTIAHGFLSLSLIPAFAAEVYEIKGAAMIVNYGLNRVRFIAPVRVDSRLRGRTVLADAVPIDQGLQVVFDTTIEIGGGDRPAAVVQAVQAVFFDRSM